MDIVSRTPFTLKLIQRFPGYKESVGSKFSMNERDIWENGFYTLAAEENETLEVLFDSADKNARLYLEALDVMPYDDKNLFEDEENFDRLRACRTEQEVLDLIDRTNAAA